MGIRPAFAIIGGSFTGFSSRARHRFTHRPSTPPMSFATTLRSAIPLALGLAIGGVGATLFLQSMPGEEGSPEERANKLEVELKKARNEIASLEASLPGGARRGGRTFRDGARGIAEDIKAGRPVTPEDIFRASQPLMRDFSPLIDRMRVRQEQRRADSISGELARKYDLNPAQQESLKKWFEKKAEDDAKRFSDLVGSDSTRLQDLMRAGQDMRPDDGLDSFMESTLSGEKLADFKADRLTERAERVQQEADMKVQRLDGIVGLDPAQRDQVFGIMARGSRDYDPSMELEGAAGDIGNTPGGNSNDAMLSVLRPEQREAYQAERDRRREETRKDLESMGLSMPPEWDDLRDFD